VNRSGASWGVPFASFREALDFLEGTLNYEKMTSWAYSPKKLDLSRTERLLEFLGNPQREFKSIHVAGTKGKGSTAAVIASCLERAGYKVGLLTSPHLVSPCERMKANGRNVPEARFCLLLETVKDYVIARRAERVSDAPTYFEILTALGFEYFRQEDVDWAVVEVGLGGRLDSTNVIRPECCVVTPIGFDHTEKLGSAIGSIAAEKAGIMKRGVPVVLARQRYPDALEVLRERAEGTGCPHWEVDREVTIDSGQPLSLDDANPQGRTGWNFSVRTPFRRYEGLFTPLLGFHQVENCATAVAALDLLKQAGKLAFSPEELAGGISAATSPARVEVLRRRPLLVLDSAHTVESVQGLMAALETHFPGKTPVMVFGCSKGKDLPGMLRLLRGRCRSLTATQADSPRAVPAEDIARAASASGIEAVSTAVPASRAVAEAMARAGGQDLVCVAGSFFIAGEVRHDWMQPRP